MSESTGPEAQSIRVSRVPLHKLVHDPRNARLHPDANRAAIRKSLIAHGQIEPLVVQSSTLRVLGGNARLTEMMELGWTHASVVKLDVDDAEADKIAVRLNRTAELAEWDTDKLADLLRDIEGMTPDEEVAYDVTALGFTEDELAALFESSPASKTEAGSAAGASDPGSGAGGGGPVTAEYVDLSLPMLVSERASAYDTLRAAKSVYGVDNQSAALLAILRDWTATHGGIHG